MRELKDHDEEVLGGMHRRLNSIKMDPQMKLMVLDALQEEQRAVQARREGEIARRLSR